MCVSSVIEKRLSDFILDFTMLQQKRNKKQNQNHNQHLQLFSF